MDSGSYISLNIGNPLCYFLGGTLCYILSGLAILVIGVVITSVTFQNLDAHHDAKKERYAGPILIGAGILVMGKGAVFRIKESECHSSLKRHWNGLRRRLRAISQHYTNNAKMQKILQSTVCNIAGGTVLLVVGILVTSVSMKQYKEHSNVFLIGPIMMTVGILTLTKSLMHYVKEQNGWDEGGVRRRRSRSTQASSSTRRAQRRDSESAICLGPTDSEELTYEDEPPPYESLAHSPGALTTLPSLPPYDGGLVNPALDDTPHMDSLPLPLPANWTQEPAVVSELEPPPLYTPQPSPVRHVDERCASPEPIRWILDPTMGATWCTDAASPEPPPSPLPVYEGEPVPGSRSTSPCPASWLEDSRPPPPSYEEVLAMPGRSSHTTTTTTTTITTNAQSAPTIPAASGTTTVTESAILLMDAENTTTNPPAPAR